MGENVRDRMVVNVNYVSFPNMCVYIVKDNILCETSLVELGMSIREFDTSTGIELRNPNFQGTKIHFKSLVPVPKFLN